MASTRITEGFKLLGRACRRSLVLGKVSNVKGRYVGPYVFAFVTAVAFGQVSARASDDLPALPSLRHLTFGVDVEVRDVYEYRPLPRRRLVKGQLVDEPGVPPTRTRENAGTFKGRLICDVVAATPDGGLAVDVAEEAEGRQAAVVRVAIEPNGHLIYPPRKTLFEEEIGLLHLLAREVVGPQPHALGTSWSIDDSGKSYESKTTFRVTGSKASNEIELESDEQYRISGAGSETGSVLGKITYDQPKLVPRTANFLLLARKQTPEGPHVIHITISLALLEDSFAAR